MTGFKLPGTVWSGLLVALPLLAAWMEQYFPGAIWAAPVAGLLLIGAKVISVYMGSGEPTPPPGAPRPAGDVHFVPAKAPEPPSRAARVLWG